MFIIYGGYHGELDFMFHPFGMKGGGGTKKPDKSGYFCSEEQFWLRISTTLPVRLFFYSKTYSPAGEWHLKRYSPIAFFIRQTPDSPKSYVHVLSFHFLCAQGRPIFAH